MGVGAGVSIRFQKRIYVTLPDESSRSNLFRQYTERLKMEKSLKPEDFASITEGYSASDVKDICQSAQLRVIDELFQSGKAMEMGSATRSISPSDFKEI